MSERDSGGGDSYRRHFISLCSKLVLIFTLVLTLLCLFVSTPPTSALDSPTLRINPATSVTHLVPGSVGHYEITASNESERELELKVYAEPWGGSGSNGSGKVRTQISRWIEFEQTKYSLPAGESVAIVYSINVPLDVPYGEQLAIIYVEGSPVSSASSSSIAPIPRLGSVVKATISGDTRDGIEITDLSLPGFLVKGPVTASSTVTNIGNTDLNAIFHLSATDIFGRTIYDQSNSFLITPGTSQTITQDWESTPLLGIFNVKYTVRAFGKEEELARVVIILPIVFIILISLVLVGAIFWVVSFVRRRRSHKKHLTVQKRLKDKRK